MLTFCVYIYGAMTSFNRYFPCKKRNKPDSNQQETVLHDNTQIWLRLTATLMAVLLGVAIPLLPAGIAVTQGAFALAFLAAIFISWSHATVRSRMASLLRTPISFALAVMFVVWFVTTLWSDNLWSSATTALRIPLYMLAAAYIYATLIERPNIRDQALRITLITTAISSVVCVVFYILQNYTADKGVFLWGEPISTSLYFKAYGSASMCLIPVLLLAGYRLGRVWLVVAISNVALVLLVISINTSRSAMAGILAMVAATVLSFILARRQYLMQLGALVLAVFGGGLTWVWLNRRWSGAETLDTTYLPTWLIDPHRQYIWKFTFEKFLENPWTGYGINRINYIPGADTKIIELEKFDVPVISSHPHNWVLEVLVETGVFGLTAIMIVLCLLAYRLLKSYGERQEMTPLALIALSAGFFGSNLFNFSFWSTWWELIYFVLFAIVASTSQEQPEAYTKSPHRPPQPA